MFGVFIPWVYEKDRLGNWMARKPGTMESLFFAVNAGNIAANASVSSLFPESPVFLSPQL